MYIIIEKIKFVSLHELGLWQETGDLRVLSY